LTRPPNGLYFRGVSTKGTPVAEASVKVYVVAGGRLLKHRGRRDAPDVRAVLEALRERFGADFGRDVYDGTLKDEQVLLLNDRALRDDDLDTPLSDGDVLFLFTAISGG